MISPLQYLNEERGSHLHMLSECLQHVTLLVKVYQDVVFLQLVDCFCHLQGALCQLFTDEVVVRRWDTQDICATRFEVLHLVKNGHNMIYSV